MKRTVLFLCASNSVHGPMAEALLKRIDSEHFEAVSAAVTPRQVHPLTVEVMKEIGINLERHVPKAVEDVTPRSFDFVITLGDPVRGSFAGQPGEFVHWQFENPAASADLEKQRRAFRAVRDQLAQRLHLFVLVQVRAKAFAADARRVQRSQPSLVG